jgi:alpha-galactosidase
MVRITKQIMIMKKDQLVFLAVAILLSFQTGYGQHVAQTPPMGWNSYDCFGAAVKESEVRYAADVMSAHLKQFGWEYIVVDYCWHYPYIAAFENPPQNDNFQPRLIMDEYARVLPAEDRFPSAAGGMGFKDLGDYIHGRGLKFGIHVMRGIPRQAVADKTPILGTKYTAADIAEPWDTCVWLDHMYGVDMSKPGAQEYYNSLFDLYASWDVDFVKVDDILSPFHEAEIAGIRKAIEQCGRPMVLSLSHGATTPLEKAEFLKEEADMWRISADFWDRWHDLHRMFALCEKWQDHIGPGHFPDADMIPFGKLRRRGPFAPEEESRFTGEEKQTLMTLWCIFRSPLMYGGDLTELYKNELKYIGNPSVLKVNQHSENNRLLFRRGNHVAWTADDPDSEDKYLAVFNLGEDTETPVYVDLRDLGFNGKCQIQDLWKHKDLGTFEKEFTPLITVHGSGMYRISATR